MLARLGWSIVATDQAAGFNTLTATATRPATPPAELQSAAMHAAQLLAVHGWTMARIDFMTERPIITFRRPA